MRRQSGNRPERTEREGAARSARACAGLRPSQHATGVGSGERMAVQMLSASVHSASGCCCSTTTLGSPPLSRPIASSTRAASSAQYKTAAWPTRASRTDVSRCQPAAHRLHVHALPEALIEPRVPFTAGGRGHVGRVQRHCGGLQRRRGRGRAHERTAKSMMVKEVVNTKTGANLPAGNPAVPKRRRRAVPRTGIPQGSGNSRCCAEPSPAITRHLPPAAAHCR